MQNERGKDFKILSTVQDVTQLRQQQEALEQTQAIVRAAFNNNDHFGIYIFDLEYKLLEYNQESTRRMKEWYGISLFKGMDIRSCLQPMVLEVLIPVFRKALAGENMHIEYKMPENNSPDTWTEMFVGPLLSVCAWKECFRLLRMSRRLNCTC